MHESLQALPDMLQDILKAVDFAQRARETSWSEESDRYCMSLKTARVMGLTATLVYENYDTPSINLITILTTALLENYDTKLDSLIKEGI